MPMVLSIAPLYTLGQDDQNVVQHDFFVMQEHWCHHWHHMMLMVLSMAPLHFYIKLTEIR